MDIKILSSLLFSTNIIGNFYLENYIYAIFFLLLFISSCIYHYINSDESFGFDTSNTACKYQDITFFVDQLALYAVIIYGGYYFINKKDYNLLVYSIIIIMFISCAILYFGGKIFEHLCFHPDKNCSDKFHVLMHICASLGHHFIVFG
jgi:hypothetical protein